MDGLVAQCSARLQQQVGPQGAPGEAWRGGTGPCPPGARSGVPGPGRWGLGGEPPPGGGRERTHRSRARPLVHPPAPSQHVLLGWSLASSLQPPLGVPPAPRTRVAAGVAGGGRGRREAPGVRGCSSASLLAVVLSKRNSEKPRAGLIPRRDFARCLRRHKLTVKAKVGRCRDLRRPGREGWEAGSSSSSPRPGSGCIALTQQPRVQADRANGRVGCSGHLFWVRVGV